VTAPFDSIRIIDPTARTFGPLAIMGNQGQQSGRRAFHPFRRLPAGDISVWYLDNNR
jgi:hypothetical protein